VSFAANFLLAWQDLAGYQQRDKGNGTESFSLCPFVPKHSAFIVQHFLVQSSQMTTLEDVTGVAEVMNDFPRPWYVAGGWAIHLFAPDPPREHEALEIGIFRADQAELREQLAGWSLEKIVRTPAGPEWADWDADEFLALPTHQARAVNPLPVSPEHFEIFLNEGDGSQWQSRRHPGLSRPIDETIVRSIDGIPYLAPEIQLLYKAKYHREKDEHDFAAVLPAMNAEQRQWLRDALLRFHPDDGWLALL
jgi:hypothetical protein